MFIVSVCMLILSIMLLWLDLWSYYILSRCNKIQLEGKIYTKIVSDQVLYGWVQSRDIIAIQNNMRSPEEHIRVETRGDLNLVQVRSIKQLVVEKNIVKILIGNR